MASTGARMLELLTLLQSRHHWSGDDLADRLEVSDRTLRRDIERLRDLGYPVEATRGTDGGYKLGPGGRLPPLLLTTDEAVAIAIGLRTAASQPIGGMAEAAISALVKITQTLTPQLQTQAEAIASTVATSTGTADNVSLDTLTVIARASRDKRQLRFTYSSATGDTSDRHVEPHHLVPLDQRWYLVAYDTNRKDWRTFRLDRLTQPSPTLQPFSPRPLPAADPTTYVTSTLANVPTTYAVDVEVRAPLDSVQAELGPWGNATPTGPSTTRFTMNVDDLSWVVLMLAGINAPVHDAEPPELRALLDQLVNHLRASTKSAPNLAFTSSRLTGIHRAST